MSVYFQDDTIEKFGVVTPVVYFMLQKTKRGKGTFWEKEKSDVIDPVKPYVPKRKR